MNFSMRSASVQFRQAFKEDTLHCSSFLQELCSFFVSFSSNLVIATTPMDSQVQKASPKRTLIVLYAANKKMFHLP